MIELARRLASEAGANDLVRFIAADFEEWSRQSDERFDLGLAMGVLDYVAEPADLLRSMMVHCDRIAVSFPRRVHPLTPIRIVKFKTQACPLFLYSRGDLNRIAAAAGIDHFEIKPFHRDYLMTASSR